MIYLKGTLQAEFHATYYGRSEVQSRTAAAGLFCAAQEGYYQEIEIPAAINEGCSHNLFSNGGMFKQVITIKIQIEIKQQT